MTKIVYDQPCIGDGRTLNEEKARVLKLLNEMEPPPTGGHIYDSSVTSLREETRRELRRLLEEEPREFLRLEFIHGIKP